jgi:hypothetical protein
MGHDHVAAFSSAPPAGQRQAGMVLNRSSVVRGREEGVGMGGDKGAANRGKWGQERGQEVEKCPGAAGTA